MKNGAGRDSTGFAQVLAQKTAAIQFSPYHAPPPPPRVVAPAPAPAPAPVPAAPKPAAPAAVDVEAPISTAVTSDATGGRGGRAAKRGRASLETEAALSPKRGSGKK